MVESRDVSVTSYEFDMSRIEAHSSARDFKLYAVCGLVRGLVFVNQYVNPSPVHTSTASQLALRHSSGPQSLEGCSSINANEVCN